MYFFFSTAYDIIYSSDFQGEHISDLLRRYAFVVIEIDQFYNIFCNSFSWHILYWNIRALVALRTIIFITKISFTSPFHIPPYLKNSKCATFLGNNGVFVLLFSYFVILIQYANIFLTLFILWKLFCCCYYCNVCGLMIVNKSSYRMCVKIKKVCKDFVVGIFECRAYYFLLCKDFFFDKLYMWLCCLLSLRGLGTFLCM